MENSVLGISRVMDGSSAHVQSRHVCGSYDSGVNANGGRDRLSVLGGARAGPRPLLLLLLLLLLLHEAPLRMHLKPYEHAHDDCPSNATIKSAVCGQMPSGFLVVIILLESDPAAFSTAERTAAVTSTASTTASSARASAIRSGGGIFFHQSKSLATSHTASFGHLHGLASSRVDGSGVVNEVVQMQCGLDRRL
jgi:hypothetical protein